MKVGLDQLFEARLRGVEQVGAHAGRPAGIVHERVDCPEPGDDALDESNPIGGECHVGLNVTSGPSVSAELREHVLHRVFRAEPAEGEGPTLARQRPAHAKANTARATGHEGDGMRRNAVRHDDQCQQERELVP